MNKLPTIILDKQYSTYHGKVHIPYITTKSRIFSEEGIYMNSVCADHVTPKNKN